MAPTTLPSDPAAAPADAAYSFKPSLMGPSHAFRLLPDALEWEIGRHRGRVPYGDIRRVRLSFRPVSLAWQRFLAEIWAEDAPKLQIASTSWRSMVEQVRQDAAYAAFIRALHARLAQQGRGVVLEAGSAPWIYWPAVALLVAVAPALAFLVARGMQAGAWGGVALVAAFLGASGWQIGVILRRNRPGRYRAEAVPDAVLPRSRRG